MALIVLGVAHEEQVPRRDSQRTLPVSGSDAQCGQ